jgi:hypothetical protein
MDPALGAMLGYIANFKVDMLAIGSISVPLSQLSFSMVSDQTFTGFRFKVPSTDVDQKSLQALYSEAQKFVQERHGGVKYSAVSGRRFLTQLMRKSSCRDD